MMAHDHVGIPKFIEKGFSNNNQVFVFDTIRNKRYPMSIDRLGTENDYYDEDVEKIILANGIEDNFSQLYNDFCGTQDIRTMKKILDLNVELVEQFFSFMYLRAKKTLEQINNESITTKIFGDLDHSELLRIQTVINTNPLKIIGEEYSFYPVINFSKRLFLDNSIGFGLMINKEKEYSFVIPLNARVAILISGNKELTDFDYLYIESTGDNKTNVINKCLVRMEKVLGNGFFFGCDEHLIDEYTNYYKIVKVVPENE